MIILKFGGSSVADAARIRNVASIISSYHEPVAVVCSALGGVTDFLIAMSNLAAQGDSAYKAQLDAFRQRHYEVVDGLLTGKARADFIPELEENMQVLSHLMQGIFLVMEASPRTMDYVLSFGERNANQIVAAYLNQENIAAEYLDARHVIKTDKSFGSALVDFELSYKKIRKYFADRQAIQIVTGFISSAKGGLTTTLGRGGSDYTASILGAALDAREIQIWTDVDGVLTADPRKVKMAFTIPTLSYAEAMEMSHFGAKVIYPPTIQPALTKGIPIYIKNTFNPGFLGTRIDNHHDPQAPAVKGISSISDIALLTLQGSGLFGVIGSAARLFSALAAQNINVILITQGSSEHSISFAVNPSMAKKAKTCVENAFEREIEKGTIEQVKVEQDLSVVAIIGENMRYRPGIAGRLFQALGKNGINVIAIAQGSSELNISVVVNKANEAKTLNVLHEAFFLSDTKVLHVFMVGVGLIGSTLLNQLRDQGPFLKEKRSLEIRIVALANSKKMVFAEDGLDLNHWQETLRNSSEKSSLDRFVDYMKGANLSNSVFIDNTASSSVPAKYAEILGASISICTPNKIASSSEYEMYRRLKDLANRKRVAYFFETNVGAGLPVISTLNDLIHSGDEILKIEGVLSGSLSYIFNTLSKDKAFSTIVANAAEKGLTEPDPRTDLSLMDVKRKLVILGREAGIPLEITDIDSENLLNEACFMAPDIPALFRELPALDPQYASRMLDLEKKEQKLRVIAKIEAGKGSITLTPVGRDNPFYTLDGSDNMIVFTTKRYAERPLVVKGPGAGAEVTAAGVFAEIIQIGSYLADN
ncbi:MAG: bifunctional aspartate kinase/homoserine dehydrogenase I [Saprospiraceae bacterium]|nr:bifunctional aspartate kinase/homoserine dehydrogenase I [Saprospiraceae bacterium]